MKKLSWKRLLGGSAAAVVVMTGLIGFAHTPRGRALRPLLFAINRLAPGANRAAVAAVAAVSPTTRGATDAENLLELMRLDKKSVSGKLRLILWRGIGHAEVMAGVPEVEILRILAS